jgi:hypothetical protein
MSPVDLVTVAGLLILRVGIPVGVVALLAYGLHRLDRRWEAEARAQSAPSLAAPPPAAQAPRPATRGVDVPGPQLPYEPALAPRPASWAASATAQPCWEKHGCGERERRACPAHANPTVICWQARLRVERQLPERCFTCDIFAGQPPA